MALAFLPDLLLPAKRPETKPELARRDISLYLTLIGTAGSEGSFLEYSPFSSRESIKHLISGVTCNPSSV